MPYYFRLLHTDILPQKLSRRSRIVMLPGRSCLYENRHGEAGHPAGLGDGALVTEIRERDDDAIDRVPVFAKEFGATRGLGSRFDSHRVFM